MKMKTYAPKDNELLRTAELEAPVFMSPEGKRLFLTVPQSEEQLAKAWDVLRFYTINTAVKKGIEAEDLDNVEDVTDYHFDPELSYLVLAAVDGKRQPKATAATEIASIDDVLGGLGIKANISRKGVGLIYQIGHAFETEFEGYDFHTEKGLYKATADLLQRIALIRKRDWLGVVTEAVAEETELRALTTGTGFNVLVPNEFYRPPATQPKKAKEAAVTDLVLLGKDVPKDVPDEFKEMAANAYVACAYCEGQDIEPALKLIKEYFALNR